jgi:hypothetical protein
MESKLTTNFQFMDGSERYTLGTVATREAAIAACCRVVDESLAHLHKPGMSADRSSKPTGASAMIRLSSAANGAPGITPKNVRRK